MNGKQQLVAFLGVALIVANLVTNRNTASGSDKLTAMLFSPGQSADELSAAHRQLLSLAAESLLLLVLLVLAGVSDGMASIAVVFTLGLALVWAMTHFGSQGMGVGAKLGMSRAQ